MRLCDKCGQPVDPRNDALVLQAGALAVAGHEHDAMMMVMTCQSRHLLPTGDCEGSPSRAQYLEGVERDPRGVDSYAYNPEVEPVMRQAYAEMQEHGWTRPEL